MNTTSGNSSKACGSTQQRRIARYIYIYNLKRSVPDDQWDITVVVAGWQAQMNRATEADDTLLLFGADILRWKDTSLVNSNSIDVPFSLIVQCGRTIQSRCSVWTYHSVSLFSLDVPFSLIVQCGRTIQSHCSVWTYHSVSLFSRDVPFSLIVQCGRTIQSHCSVWTYHSVSLFSMDVPFSLIVQYGRTIQSHCSAGTYHSVSSFSRDVPFSLIAQQGRTIQSHCSAWTYHSVSLFSMDVPFSLVVQQGRSIQSHCSVWTYHSVSLFSRDVPFSLIVQRRRTIQSHCSAGTYHSVSVFPCLQDPKVGWMKTQSCRSQRNARSDARRQRCPTPWHAQQDSAPQLTNDSCHFSSIALARGRKINVGPRRNLSVMSPPSSTRMRVLRHVTYSTLTSLLNWILFCLHLIIIMIELFL